MGKLNHINCIARRIADRQSDNGTLTTTAVGIVNFRFVAAKLSSLPGNCNTLSPFATVSCEYLKPEWIFTQNTFDTISTSNFTTYRSLN